MVLRHNPDVIFTPLHYKESSAKRRTWELKKKSRSALREQQWFTVKFIHCDVSHNTLVPHYKHISVFLAGREPTQVCSPLQRKPCEKRRAHCSALHLHAEKIYWRRFDAQCALIWQWKRGWTEEAGEKVWEESCRDKSMDHVTNVTLCFYCFALNYRKGTMLNAFDSSLISSFKFIFTNILLV